MSSSVLEEELVAQIRRAGLPEPEREVRFCDTRRWRFDLAWPAAGLAVEVDGGVWARGRHNRGAGFIADAEKYNTGQLLGWVILRYTDREIRDGSACREIAEALRIRAGIGPTDS